MIHARILVDSRFGDYNGKVVLSLDRQYETPLAIVSLEQFDKMIEEMMEARSEFNEQRAEHQLQRHKAELEKAVKK